MDTTQSPDEDPKDPFLAALGERTRALRARRGLTRKGLAKAAQVSERHLANIEMGVGNASVQFLRPLAQALNCSMSELVGDEADNSPEWLMIREILRGRSEAELTLARASLVKLFNKQADAMPRSQRIALIGLRGAGKSTLGRLLAEREKLPFVELSRSIETLAGCSMSEIHSLYGPAAYQRYEKRALEETIARYPSAVIATPGGIVSDPATFSLLLTHCHSIWLRATPEEHMSRVLAQGDTRPMAGRPGVKGNQEAMNDLRHILDSRTPFYSKADSVLDTSKLAVDVAANSLWEQAQRLLSRPT